jgi:hypothetical protein
VPPLGDELIRKFEPGSTVKFHNCSALQRPPVIFGLLRN